MSAKPGGLGTGAAGRKRKWRGAGRGEEERKGGEKKKWENK